MMDARELLDVASSVSSKGFYSEDNSLEKASLIPGLSDDVAQLCLAKVARVALLKLRCVCTAWKHLCESEDFLDLRYQVGSTEAWLYVLTEKPSGCPFKAFSPRLNKWFELPHILKSSEQLSLQGFACVALDSRLLLMGGVHQTFDKIRQEYSQGVVSGDVQVYNACTNKWSRAPSMKTPRSWFAAAVIGECVFVAGGQGKNCFLNSVEVYNVRTNTWSYAPSMIHVRCSCRGLAVGGKFWVVGGEYIRNQYGQRPERGSAEVYDPESGRWTLIPQMWLNSEKVPGPSTVHHGKMLFAHRSKLMMYDDCKNSWHHVGYVSSVDMFDERKSRYGFACESMDGELYMVGGVRVNRHLLQCLNTTEVSKQRFYGPSKYTLWQNRADMGANEGIVLASAIVRI